MTLAHNEKLHQINVEQRTWHKRHAALIERKCQIDSARKATKRASGRLISRHGSNRESARRREHVEVEAQSKAETDRTIKPEPKTFRPDSSPMKRRSSQRVCVSASEFSKWRLQDSVKNLT